MVQKSAALAILSIQHFFIYMIYTFKTSYS